MKGRVSQIRNVVFCVLVAVFVVLSMALVGLISLPLFETAIAFGLLGLVLVVLTSRLRETRIQKVFIILTGASAAGIPLCAILHNVLYGLFLVGFGEGSWEKHTPGGDEPGFFILALVVSPTLFLIGTVGSIVLLIKARIAKRASVP